MVHNENNQMLELLHFINEIIDDNFSYEPDSSMFVEAYQDMYEAILKLRNKTRRYGFEVQAASSQVMSVTDDLTLSLKENTSVIQQLYSEAKEIQQLNTDSQEAILLAMNEIKQMAELFNEIRNTSGQVKESSAQSKTVLNESMKEIFEIVESVGNIKQSTESTIEYIDRLKISTNQIEHILVSVKDISLKIQIISLNASIESARAGIAGRGFAVLAQEMKRLADLSRQAVDEISGIITQVSTEMGSLDEHIEQNSINVLKSVDCAKKVENSLGRIEQTYGDVQDMVQTIVSVTETEAQRTNEINKKASKVETISKEVTSGFQHLYEDISRQKNITEQIGNLGNYLSTASNSLSMLIEKSKIDLTNQNNQQFLNVAEDMFKMFKEELLCIPEFPAMQPEHHKKILDKVMANNKMIEAIWSNNQNGKFIYSNPAAGIANAKVRDWFKSSVQGNQYLSDVYISAITKNPCITISLPILDKGGEIMGVLGADLKFLTD